ncbi:MAG: putative rane protein [Myxococcaceae bacterium]|nr:putative rane protein [Myxococcaceae bacterium]
MLQALPDGVYAALTAALALALAGGLGLWAEEPCLFPSLGPTIFLQTMSPNEPASRVWNTAVGHALGIAAALLALFVTNAFDAPPAMAPGALTVERIAATGLAVPLTILLQIPLRALHPPAAATTMLLTLGGLKAEPRVLFSIAAGVTLITLFGEVARQLHPQLEPRKDS